jgi:hypothetical protein
MGKCHCHKRKLFLPPNLHTGQAGRRQPWHRGGISYVTANRMSVIPRWIGGLGAQPCCAFRAFWRNNHKKWVSLRIEAVFWAVPLLKLCPYDAHLRLKRRETTAAGSRQSVNSETLHAVPRMTRLRDSPYRFEGNGSNAILRLCSPHGVHNPDVIEAW